MASEKIGKTLLTALAVCLVCSALVSVTAVSLQDMQGKNRALDRIRNILEAAGLSSSDRDPVLLYKEIVTPVLIDLAAGRPLSGTGGDTALDADNFDIRSMARDQAYGRDIPAREDIAGIRRMPVIMPVYIIRKGNMTEQVVLPVYGKGLWSTMYGFIALGSDLQTVTGFTFYEQGETPGLGGEVDNPRWKDSWKGKQALDKRGNVLIEVIKGKVNMSGPGAGYQIDGLSGATLTSRGVNNLIRFWLGKNGYSNYLKNMKDTLNGQI